MASNFIVDVFTPGGRTGEPLASAFLRWGSLQPTLFWRSFEHGLATTIPTHLMLRRQRSAVSISRSPVTIHGNRDLPGNALPRKAGMIAIAGRKVLELLVAAIMHGDTQYSMTPVVVSRQSPQTAAANAIPRSCRCLCKSHVTARECEANHKEVFRQQ